MARPGGGGGSRSSSSRSSSRSRSSGRRSSGSSISRSRPSSSRSYSSSSSRRYSSGSRRTTVHHYHHGGGYGYSGGYQSFGSRVVSIIMSYIVCMIIILVAMFVLNSNVGGGVKNTTQREKIDASIVKETDYFIDELGYFDQRSVLERGLKNFYEDTNIQPFIYVKDIDEIETYDVQENLDALYEDLFDDEGHFLLMVFGDEQGTVDWEYIYVSGRSADSVMDNEAIDILFNYIDTNYYSNMTDEELFSDAFSRTGDKIMSKPTNGFDVLKTVVKVIGPVSLVVVVFIIWKAKKKQDNIEAEQTQKILDTPIDKISDPNINDLKDKYN